MTWLKNIITVLTVLTLCFLEAGEYLTFASKTYSSINFIIHLFIHFLGTNNLFQTILHFLIYAILIYTSLIYNRKFIINFIDVVSCVTLFMYYIRQVLQWFGWKFKFYEKCISSYVLHYIFQVSHFKIKYNPLIKV